MRAIWPLTMNGLVGVSLDWAVPCKRSGFRRVSFRGSPQHRAVAGSTVALEGMPGFAIIKSVPHASGIRSFRSVGNPAQNQREVNSPRSPQPSGFRNVAR